MRQNGESKLALCIDQAKLKNGKTVPVKATIVGIYAPGIGPATPYPVQPGDQVANDWTSSIHQVDQIGALSGVDMHSSLTSKNSGVLVSTKKDEMGIYLTPVTTICSVFGRGRLSAEPAGVGDTLFDRGGLPGILVSTSLAGGLSLPALRREKELAEA
jgi:hypothetical protein